MSKPVPIDLTAHAALVEDAREFLRLWSKDDRVVCFVNPRQLDADPMALGVALVDAVRHGAKAWAKAVRITEAEAEARIWAGVDAERGNVLDLGEAAAAPEVTSDDGFITYAKPDTLN